VAAVIGLLHTGMATILFSAGLLALKKVRFTFVKFATPECLPWPQSYDEFVDRPSGLVSFGRITGFLALVVHDMILIRYSSGPGH
jgi:hypothetical protein